MHVVVSISLATRSPRCVPAPGTVPACPEMACTLKVDLLIGGASYLLHLHQKPLELRCERVRINRRRRQHIRRSQRGLAFILGDSAIAPVNRNADLLGLLPVDAHRYDAHRRKEALPDRHSDSL